MGEQIVESCSYQNRLNFALGGGGEEKSRVVETCLKKLPPKHHFLLVKCLGELQAVLMIYVWRKWREVFSSGHCWVKPHAGLEQLKILSASLRKALCPLSVARRREWSSELLYFFPMCHFYQTVGREQWHPTETGTQGPPRCFTHFTQGIKILGALMSVIAFCILLCFKRWHVCRLPDACYCLELLPRETSGFLTSSFITALEGNQGFQYYIYCWL